ncbi:MAG: hypothetical protein O6952_02890, partial [Planctomycetota bacterium]|nr:hypothetical protein [Planctomycetota bacterium]
RSIEISVAGAFFAAIPLFVMLQFERPLHASPAFMMAGAVILAMGMGRVRYRWGEAASRPLAVYAIGLSLLALLLGAAVLFFHALRGSFSISTISTVHLALAGAGTAFLHLQWARAPSREWHLAPLNAGCLLLLFAGVEALDLSGHFYALLPALLAAINAGLSRSEGAVRYRRPLAWCAVALVIATLVHYVPAVYALSTQPSAFWPVATALISALALTMVASGGSSLTLRRAAISLVFLAVLFQLTLKSPAFDWRPLFAAFALAGCFVGYLWARVGIARWGRAAVGVSALVALALAWVALIRVSTGDMSLVAATFQFTFCAFALGISGLSAQQGTLQRAQAPLIVLAANLSLLGGTLSLFAFLDYSIPFQGILLSLLAIAFMVLGIRCERRKLGLIPGVFYGSIGIVAAISIAFTWGTVEQAWGTYWCYAAVFGAGSYLIRRELFFYAAAISFSLGFLFLMRYSGASALTVAMWEASLAIAYVGMGRFFFPRRSWNTDPLLLTALPMALGVVVTFVLFRSRALDIGPNLHTSIRTSLILAGLFATMAWTARERRFYAISLLMGLSAYYLTLRLQGAVLTEWFTTPPAFIAAGIGVLELKGKTRWLASWFPAGGLIIIGLLIFYVPSLYRSRIPELTYEGIQIGVTSLAVLLGTAFYLRVRTLFWGGASVFLLNFIIQTFHIINFAAIPKEVWWGISAVVLIASGLLLEKRVNARLKERVALAKGKMEKFFAEWV